MPSIGFIGVGHMGAPMARNLLKAGHQVTVFDPNAENAKAMVAGGAKQAASLVELSATNDIIVSMLPSGRELKVAYLDNDGIVAHAKAGALLIDCSTTDVDSARAVARGRQEARPAVHRCAGFRRRGRRGGGLPDLHGRRRGRGAWMPHGRS